MSPNIELPSYGYNITENTDNIIITIPKRKSPTDRIGAVEDGCLLTFYYILAIGSGIIGTRMIFRGHLWGAILIVIPIIVCYTLTRASMRNISDKWKNPHLYSDVIINIKPKTMIVNNTEYDRGHITGWTTRWTDAAGSDYELKKAKHSYEITFDYGDRQILVVGGMTEAKANTIMNAILTSLSKIAYDEMG
jgi:hypothetical protein